MKARALTVKELVKQLQECDQDATVNIVTYDDDVQFVDSVYKDEDDNSVNIRTWIKVDVGRW